MKPDADEPIGFDGLRACVLLAKRPAVAIGGMTVDVVPEVIAAGAEGVAVVAAIAGAADPEDAAAAFATAIRHHKQKREARR